MVLGSPGGALRSAVDGLKAAERALAREEPDKMLEDGPRVRAKIRAYNPKPLNP